MLIFHLKIAQGAILVSEEIDQDNHRLEHGCQIFLAITVGAWINFPSHYGWSMDKFSKEHGQISLASMAGAWIKFSELVRPELGDFPQPRRPEQESLCLNLRTLFKQRGSFILENQIELQKP
ncbi:unnamed protein product [Paramecium octaurelia]|uniref:Uncharacterized protein n=1 Tax=Paramecium octaurelia TaxID=43137 RepID=A0A8S1W7X1_PAROT|nr:unnamed protein product [Paramecium octaurelia]